MTKLNRRRFLTITAAAATLPCSVLAASKTWTGFAFGAEVSIKLYGASGDTGEAMDAAIERMVALEKEFSIYDPNSTLSKLNAAGRLVSPPTDLIKLMQWCNLVHEETDGLFDPTVQSIFEARAREIPYTIRTAASSTGWHRISFDEQAIEFVDPRMSLTFNGIAQGYATDAVKSVLAENGFTQVLVNIGEYAAGDYNFNIGVADHKDMILRVESLKNQAIATSSPHGYRFRDGSSHIISPDGRNIAPVWDTVSVVADHAVLADGFSTALVLTPDTSLATKLKENDLVQKVILQATDGKILTI